MGGRETRGHVVCSKNGGLCRHCSLDVDEFASRLTRPLGLRSAQSVSLRLRRSAPLDRRLLFVAELTGHCSPVRRPPLVPSASSMVGCVGNAPTLVRLDIRFTGGSRSLRGYQPEMVCSPAHRPPYSLPPPRRDVECVAR